MGGQRKLMVYPAGERTRTGVPRLRSSRPTSTTAGLATSNPMNVASLAGPGWMVSVWALLSLRHQARVGQ